jgi:hypothetical protein
MRTVSTRLEASWWCNANETLLVSPNFNQPNEPKRPWKPKRASTGSLPEIRPITFGVITFGGMPLHARPDRNHELLRVVRNLTSPPFRRIPRRFPQRSGTHAPRAPSCPSPSPPRLAGTGERIGHHWRGHLLHRRPEPLPALPQGHETGLWSGVPVQLQHDRYAIRLQALNGTLQAYDNRSSDSLQLLRDLHFRARLLEFSGLLEVNFFKYRKRGKDGKKWTPFVFAGLCLFPHQSHRPNWMTPGTNYSPLGPRAKGPRSTVGPTCTRWTTSAFPFGAGIQVEPWAAIGLPGGMGASPHIHRLFRRCERHLCGSRPAGLRERPLAANFADRSVLGQRAGVHQ